jgi:hypothetical protein
MEKFNVIVDWYFCCCIKSTPKSTQTFLAILETIDNSNVDLPTLLNAYEELALTETWMKVYALPKVLHSLNHQNINSELRQKSIGPYIEEILRSLPSEIFAEFKDIFRHFLSRDFRSCIDDIKKCLEKSPSGDNEFGTSYRNMTPYLDLIEHLPYTVMLSALYEMILDENNRGTLGEQISQIKYLITGGLSYKFGRLSFLLSCLISNKTPQLGYSTSQIFEFLMTASDSPDLEPDILQTIIEIKYSQIDNNEVCKIIFDEYRTLSDLISMMDRTRKDGKWKRLRQVGISTFDKVNSTALAIIYWQLGLLNYLARRDITSTVNSLGFYWHIPKSLDKITLINIYSPYNGDDWDTYGKETIIAKNHRIKSFFSSLLQIRFPKSEIKLNVMPNLQEKKFFMSKKFEWIFYSPWISLMKEKQDRGGKKSYKYENLESPILWIRLIGSFFISRYILEEVISSTESAPFISLLVHTANIMERGPYRTWLNELNRGDKEMEENEENIDDAPGEKTKPKKNNIQSNKPISGLIIAAYREIDIMAKKYYDFIAPQKFIDVYKIIRNEYMPPGSDQQLFLEMVFPDTMIEWVSNFFRSAAYGNIASKWIDVLPDIYNKMIYSAEYNTKLKAAVLMRFLSGNKELNDYSRFDWRFSKEEKRNWSTQYFKLLLTENLRPSEWERPDWTEGKKDIVTIDARTVERFISIMRYPGELNEQIKKKWKDDWKNWLGNLIENKNLNRFIKLRLIEILEEDLLSDEPEDQELILSLLIEFGRAYDLIRLFDALFPIKQENLMENLAFKKRDPREKLLNLMYKAIEPESFKRTKRLRPKDPVYIHLELEKNEVIKSGIARVIYNIWKYGEGPYVSFKNLIKELYAKTFAKLERDQNLNIVQGDVRFIGSGTQLILGNQERVNKSALSVTFYDPRSKQAHIYRNKFQDHSLCNFFIEKPEIVRKSYKNYSNPHSDVLAVFIGKEIIGDYCIYYFNCGFHDYVELVLDKREDQYDLKFGTWLIINIFGEIDKKRWRVSSIDKKRIYPETEFLPGDIQKFEIGGNRDYGGERQIRIVNTLTKHAEEIDLLLWFPDISWMNSVQKEPYYVYGKLNKNIRWEPLYLYLKELLLEAENYGGNFILTFIHKKMCTDKNKDALLFSLGPGKNFLIYWDEFIVKDAEKLREKLYELDNPNGLLVAVTPLFSVNQLLLGLVTEDIVNEKLLELYPELKTPFDERNLKWKNLFNQKEKSDPLLAVKCYDTGKWYYEVDTKDLPSFPGKIQVTLFGDKESDIETEFKVKTWEEKNQRLARVEATPIATYKLEIPDKKQFIRDYLGLKENDIVSGISNVLPQVKKEERELIALTNEKLKVFIETDSLTMLPFKYENVELPRNCYENRKFFVKSVYLGREFSKKPVINHPQIPEEYIRNGKCEGILTEVPKPSERNASRCMVIWFISLDGQLKVSERSEINISNLREFMDSKEKINPGYLITGNRDINGWHFEIRRKHITIRALWRISEYSNQKNNLFIGVCQNKMIAQASTGELVFLPSMENKFSPFQEIESGKNHGDKWKLSRSDKGWPSLESESHFLLGPIRKEDSPGFLLNQVKIRLTEVPGVKGYYDIHREFDLRRDNFEIKFEQQLKASTDEKISGWKKEHEEYLTNPTPLPAVYNPRFQLVIIDDKMYFPSIEEGDSNWGKKVKLAHDHGPFITTNGYRKDDALVQLFKEGEEISASFRLGYETLEQFKGEKEFNVLTKLDYLLYFVGKESEHPVTGEIYNELMYRFEWGYGHNLLVKESEILFNGEPLEKAEMFLFPGDAVTMVTFKEIEKDGSLLCVMDIDNVYIIFTESTTLFFQSFKYKIIHLLHLKKNKEEIVVEYVEGFDEGYVKNEKNKITKNFSKSRAVLAERYKERLLERFVQFDESRNKLVIPGRLNTEKYKKNSIVEFDYVRLSFQTSPYAQALDNGNILFLRAGEIKIFKNDLKLMLNYWEGRHPDDIGDDFQSAYETGKFAVLRRDVSARENLLRKLHGTTTLKNAIVMVKLSRIIDGDNIRISMLGGMPSRKTNALEDLLYTYGALYATILETENDSESIEIEYIPGVFFSLKKEQVIFYGSCKYFKGDRIKITQPRGVEGHRFHISIAAHGDFSFVENEPRPVVIFPKNYLLRDDINNNPDIYSEEYWAKSYNFTIGGLPNIEALAGYYDFKGSSWEKIRINYIWKLMETKHPKVSYLGKITESGKEFSIAPNPKINSGCLMIDDKNFKVKYYPVNTSIKITDLNWENLSFRDTSIQNIIECIRCENWNYHDTYTGHWSKNEPGQIEVINDDLTLYTHNVEYCRESVNTISGPLFFEYSNGTFFLRYYWKNLKKFGFPVDVLMDSLRLKKGMTGIYTFAGKTEDGMLWLEIAPGRIAELPPELVFLRYKTDNRNNISLKYFAWDHLVVGDQLELKLQEDEPLGIEKIIFLRWFPGPRGVFGWELCFLPVQDYLPGIGELKLGIGVYYLSFPKIFSEGNIPENVCLTLSNKIFDAKEKTPQKGDTVFIRFKDDYNIEVMGFPEFRVYPELRNPDNWKKDSLQNFLLEKFPEPYSFKFKYKNFKKLVDILGGAIPVTIEYIPQESKELYFSRRNQCYYNFLADGTISAASIIGLLPGENLTVLMRCGSELFTIPVHEIISGLPYQYWKQGIEQLKSQIIWVCRTGSKISCGIKPDQENINIEIKDTIINRENGQRPEGIICQSAESLRFYWIPEERITWIDLNIDQICKFFIERRKNLKAKLINSNITRYSSGMIASIIDVEEVKNEFEGLEIGKEFTVRILDELPIKENALFYSYLVESITSGMIFKCISYKKRIKHDEYNKEIPVEVTNKVFGVPSLLEVSYGRKIYRLDFPGTLKDNREEFFRLNDLEEFDILSILKEKENKINDSTIFTGLPEKDIKEYIYCCYHKYCEQQSQDFTFLFTDLRFAEYWIEDNISKDEISLPITIMAILLLYRAVRTDEEKLKEYLGDMDERVLKEKKRSWSKSILDMIRNVCLRSLRSFHIDILSNKWMYDPEIDKLEGNLARRAIRVKKLLYKSEIDSTDLKTIKQFYDTVNLNDNKDFGPASNALMAAIGEYTDVNLLLEDASVTRDLACLYKTIPENASEINLLDIHIDKLTKVLNKIRDGNDVTLLNNFLDDIIYQ